MADRSAVITQVVAEMQRYATVADEQWRHQADVSMLRPIRLRTDRFDALCQCADELEAALSVLKGPQRTEEKKDDTQIGSLS